MNHKKNIPKNTKYLSRMKNHLCIFRKKCSFGFTIVELLLALAISAMLLVGIATALNASFFNYRENENMFRAVNSARQAILRITNEIRTADAADPTSPANECSLITANGADITYRYNNVDNKLYLITNDDLADPDYVLCDNITAMAFTKQTFVQDFQTKVRSIQISITVQHGDTEQKISAAAVIRRNMIW
ncbi:MAG: prepilin-type N-terminal cleavage/methylation domain-containing protein [Sedimentisphaerales bacterium]|nr:prepilin-type N-terminal cleavage/methylation domain-containing protein [Sedimentisphaerales bacterium]